MHSLKEKFKAILDDIENQKFFLEENLKRLQEELTIKNNELICLKEQLTNNQNINARFLEEITKLEENSKIVEEQLTSTNFHAQSLAKANEQLGRECKELTQELELLKSEFSWERQQREQAEREITQLKKDMELERMQKLATMRLQEEDKDSILKQSKVLTTENTTLKKRVRDLSEFLKHSDQKTSKLALTILELQEIHQLDLQNLRQEFDMEKEGLQREIFKLKFASSNQLYQVISFLKAVQTSLKRVFIHLDLLKRVLVKRI